MLLSPPMERSESEKIRRFLLSVRLSGGDMHSNERNLVKHRLKIHDLSFLNA